MKDKIQEKTKSLWAKVKELFDEVDLLKYALVLVPMITLAITSTLIMDLMKVNQRLVGITFFAFILSGLIVAFNAIKMKKDTRDGLIGTAICIVLTLAFMITLAVMLESCIGKQSNLKSFNDLKTLYIYAILAIIYFFLLSCIILRFRQFNHVRKS